MPRTDPDSPGPLFDTPLDRAVANLPAETREFVRTLASEPRRSAQELLGEVRSYLKELEGLAESLEFLDLATARRLAVQCEALLSGDTDTFSDETHHLIQIAVRYFVEDEDGEGDTTSLVGFDDDAEVIVAIAKAVGREDILELGKEDD
jgi:hypothetical protein